MPAAAIPFLIGSAVAAGGQVAGAVIGSKAAKSAAKTQSAAEERVLGLQQQQYQDAQQRYAPYQQMGQNALPTLQALAGNVQSPHYGQNIKDLSIYGSKPPMAPQGQPAGPMPMSAGAMVKMRAPNGMMQDVPQALVSHYQEKGATVAQ